MTTPRTALRYQHEAVEIQRRLEDFDNFAITMHNIARGHLFLGELEEARTALEESFDVARGLGFRQVMAYCLEGLAELAMRKGNAEQAAEALGACQRQFAEIGAAQDNPEGATTQKEVMEFACAEIGSERAEELRQRGADRALDELFAFSR